MKKLLAAAILIFTASSAAAVKPQWLHKTPKEGNPTYSFVPVTVDATNLANGRSQSLKMLALDRGLLNSLKMHYRAEETSTSQSRTVNGNFSEQLDVQTVEVTSFEGKPIQVKAQIVDEYLDARHRHFSTLYRVGIVDNPWFDPVKCTDKYGARGLWRSAIIPGWGQFHKGANLKGGLILGGTAALAAGIVFTENQRSDYVRRLGQTHDINQIRSYQTKRDHFATARNICIGAAGALYIYNLIDAIAAPGARRVAVRHRAGGNTYAFMPSVAEDGTPVMMASLTF